jgi:hypothetical protein
LIRLLICVPAALYRLSISLQFGCTHQYFIKLDEENAKAIKRKMRQKHLKLHSQMPTMAYAFRTIMPSRTRDSGSWQLRRTALGGSFHSSSARHSEKA